MNDGEKGKNTYLNGLFPEGVEPSINWSSFIQTTIDHLHISQHRFAQQLGITHPTVSRWLKAESIPTKEHQAKLYKICKENEILENVLAKSRGPQDAYLMLSWKHSAQFAGYYSASQQGYYENKKIDVEIFEGGFSPKKCPIHMIDNRKWEFGITKAYNLIDARSQGINIKAVAAIFQKNPTCLIYKGEKESLPDYKIGIPDPQNTDHHNYFEASLIAKKLKLSSLDAWNLVPLSGSELENFTALFKEGAIDGIMGFINNESELLKKELAEKDANNVKEYHEYDSHKSYGDVIFTTDEIIQKKPDFVKNFIHASIRGWEHALSKKREGRNNIKYYINEIGRTIDIEHQGKLLTNWENLIRDESGHIGTMQKDMWSTMIATLEGLGNIEGIPSDSVVASDCFDCSFVQSYYKV